MKLFVTRYRVLLTVVAGFFLLYTVIGFLLFPEFLRDLASRELTKGMGRNVTIQKIHFNPYAMSLTVEGFRIDELKGGMFLSWDRFYVDFKLWSSLFHRTWMFKESFLLKFEASVVRNADGTLNFADLLLLDWPEIPQFRIKQMHLADGKVVFHDGALTSKFSIALNPLAINFENFSMSPEHKNLYSVRVVSEEGEQFSWSGFFHLDPFSSSGNIAAENVQIKKYYPYLQKFLNLSIANGTLTARTSYDLDLDRDRFKAILHNCSISVHSFKALEHKNNSPLFALTKLEIVGAEVDLKKQKIDIPSILLSGGSAVLRRLPDKSFNVQHVIKPVPTKPVTKAVTSAGWQASLGEIRLVDFAAEVKNIFGRQNLGWKELKLSNPILQTNPPTASVSATSLSDGKLIFTDYSLTPPVRISLTNLDIRIGRLSSESSRGATVAVKAKIDNSTKFQISGKSNPINKNGETNLRALVQNINLIALNPYCEKYLGYELLKGELSLDVNYLIQRRKLTARNKIEIDNLTLGEKIESKDATTLPIRLAINLLKDTDGKIRLNVPIEGTLDDPEFKITKAVLHAFFGPFKKTATFPFEALGARLGGRREDLEFQKFSSGSTRLSPGETGKLDQILKGLKRFPNLMLDIEGSVDAYKDTGNLQLLAAKRAKNVKDYLLLQETLEPDRIFLIDNSSESVPRKGSRALLRLKDKYRVSD